MVASNPLFSGHYGSLGHKFNATVINDIWPEVFFFSAIATMVCAVNKFTDVSLSIETQLLTVLGTVLGLVVSFRTSSAYERYQEGRKLWTAINLTSRNLAQQIWIHVPNDRAKCYTVTEGQLSNSSLPGLIEKKTIVNLIQAFSIAVKHMLRAEVGIYYQDLYPLVCVLPRYANMPKGGADADMLPMWKASEWDDGESPPASTPSTRAPTPSSTSEKPSTRRKNSKILDIEYALPTVASHRPLKPARDPPKTTIFDYIPFLRLFKMLFTCVRQKTRGARRGISGKMKYPEHVDSNVPLEICLYLSSYHAWLLKKGLLTPALATGIMNNISSLQDSATNLQRIRNTPLPFAYQAHLRMSMWLYLFFLPFEVFESFGWVTIPGTAFAAFLLLGFLEIGQEIENPFNYDANDLDLDGFCLTIQRELIEIIAHTSPDPESYIFTSWNQPFAPADRRTAEAMITDTEHEYHGAETGVGSVRRTLLASWRDVDQATRQHYWDASQV